MTSEDFYISDYVHRIRMAFIDLIFDYDKTIVARIDKLTDRLWTLYQCGDRVSQILVSNYHPDYLGATAEQIISAELTQKDMYQTVICEYGFHNSTVPDTKLNALFERTVDAIIHGNIVQLKLNLEQQPDLVQMKSQYGHQATLLHYVAANGVEFYRQSIGYNAPAMVEFLIDRGAEVEATMKVYGGEFITLDLLLSSAHPQEAGLVAELSSILTA